VAKSPKPRPKLRPGFPAFNSEIVERLDYAPLERAGGVTFTFDQQVRIAAACDTYLAGRTRVESRPERGDVKHMLERIETCALELGDILDGENKGASAAFVASWPWRRVRFMLRDPLREWPGDEVVTVDTVRAAAFDESWAGTYGRFMVRNLLREWGREAAEERQRLESAVNKGGRPRDSQRAWLLDDLFLIWTEAGGKGLGVNKRSGEPSGPFVALATEIFRQLSEHDPNVAKGRKGLEEACWKAAQGARRDTQDKAPVKS